MEQYEMKVGEEYYDEENISCTSLVDKPATHKLFAVFNEETSVETVKQQFKVILPTRENQQKVQNTGKFERIISGVWFMPDTDYPRLIQEGTEHKMVTASMTKDQLMLAVKNFAKNGSYNTFDIMHDGIKVEGLRTMEIWMLYDYNQMSPILLNRIEDLGYTVNDIPIGTVFMTVFVENEEFFDEYILSGRLKGFSIEGLFDLTEKETELETIEITETMTEESLYKSTEMFKTLGLEQTEGNLITDQGTLKITKETISLNDTVLEDGTFVTDNKFTVEVRQGKIVDFGFEDVPQVTGDSVTVETEAEVKEVEVSEDVKTEDKVEEVKEEVITKVEDEVKEEVIKETIEDVVKVDESKEIIKAKDKEIEDLKALLEAKEEANKELMKSQPIKRKSLNAEQTVKSETVKYETVTVGGKTYSVPVK